MGSYSFSRPENKALDHMYPVRTSVLVDGENLVMRFQAMRGDGLTQHASVVHHPDQFVWCSDLFHNGLYDIVRASYYTSVPGDAERIAQVRDEIQRCTFSNPWLETSAVERRLSAQVFHKAAKSQRSRQVDIYITLDALRTAYTHDVDQIILVTGDGDFIPVVEEIKRRGKIAGVCAFSSGLSAELSRIADEFTLLDHDFFVEK